MNTSETRKMISRLSLLAAICILAMFVVSITTGVSQEKFEIARDLADYVQGLRDGQGPLRVLFTIDLVFIVLFSTTFIFLTQHLKTGERIVNILADVALAAMLVTGVLDCFEDLHILTMMHNAIGHLPVEASEVSSQMLMSMLKFVASYFSLFIVAFILPGRTVLEKLLKYSLWFVQLPVGVLVYTAPPQATLALGMLRFIFMVSGFFLLSYNFSRGSDEVPV